MKHYTYLITNLNENHQKIFYIGVRSCKDIINDSYMGSSKNLKEDIQKYGIINFNKTILGIFNNRNDAILHEIYLHELFDVGKCDLFYNKVKQTTKGFDYSGNAHSVETKEKMSYDRSGSKHWNYGKQWSDEHKCKLRKKHKPHTKKYTEVECPYCSVIGTSNNMSRWHFDNCLNHPKNRRTNSIKRKNLKRKSNIIKFYDEYNNLIMTCHGNFIEFCKENKLPVSEFRKSYKSLL